MKNKAHLALVAAAASFGLIGNVQAETVQSKPSKSELMLLVANAEKSEKSEERKMMHLSEEGLKALQNVYQARLAIFEGHVKDAEKLLSTAKTELSAAEKGAAKLTVKLKKTDSGLQLPIDVRLAVGEDFVLTPEKAEKIAKANAHIKAGENKQAVEVLRDAGIYINVTTILLPLDAAAGAVDKAIKLVGEEKYYEANLVLKGIEDSLTVSSQTLVEWLEAKPTETKKG